VGLHDPRCRVIRAKQQMPNFVGHDATKNSGEIDHLGTISPGKGDQTLVIDTRQSRKNSKTKNAIRSEHFGPGRELLEAMQNYGQRVEDCVSRARSELQAPSASLACFVSFGAMMRVRAG
jgi:hypothetical protein